MAHERKKLIIIGGGAAGFFTAIHAASCNPGLEVQILEKTGKLLSKVKISGGGRCNVTHHCFDVEELCKKYPRGGAFLKKCLYRFGTKETIDWFAKRNVALHAEADGRMFPVTNNSQTIIDCLQEEARKNKIQISLFLGVRGFYKEGNRFYLDTSGEFISCDYLCIATGGYPKREMFTWIENMKQTGEILPAKTPEKVENDWPVTKIIPPVPSLFTFNLPQNPITQLMGIAVTDVVVKIKGSKFLQRGPVLITHWGLSGPAILKLSAFAAIELNQLQYHCTIQLNWLPAYNETSLLADWKNITVGVQQQVANHNPFQLPFRLWDYLLGFCKVDGSNKWQDVPKEKQNLLIKNLTGFECTVSGKTTFKEEFVTCGGVDLQQVSPQTLEHKQVPGLYFSGEVLNIDGVTGGFNFQNAWTTGFIAGTSIGEASL